MTSEMKKPFANLAEEIQSALDYSRNFTTAKPNIGNTEKEHILGLCNLLERLHADRDQYFRMFHWATHDLASVGEALGIPGEEQEGGSGEFIDVIEKLKQTAMSHPTLEQNDYPPCDYCGASMDYMPWHGSGILNGIESRHIHACDNCRSLLPGNNTEQSAPEQIKQAAVKLPELTPDLADILGRPNFRCYHIAQALRLVGHQIEKRSETEQAAVIHWLLSLYLKHGSAWKEEADKELKHMADKARALLEGVE